MSAGSVTSQSATDTRTTPVSAWIALAVLMLPVLLIAIDNTVLAFALPAIADAERIAEMCRMRSRGMTQTLASRSISLQHASMASLVRVAVRRIPASATE